MLLKLLFFSLLVVTVTLCIAVWREAERIKLLYGHDFRTACAAMARIVAYSTKGKSILLAGVVFFCVAIAFSEVDVAKLLDGAPVVFSVSVSVLLALVWRVVQPPAVLFLGSSDCSDTNLFAARLEQSMVGFRPLFLLRPSIGRRLRLTRSFWCNNYWFAKNPNWELAVFRLMDVVPVVVVDLRCLSSGLKLEVNRILVQRKRVGSRLIWIGDAATDAECQRYFDPNVACHLSKLTVGEVEARSRVEQIIAELARESGIGV